jgi:hypothetical protein
MIFRRAGEREGRALALVDEAEIFLTEINGIVLPKYDSSKGGLFTPRNKSSHLLREAQGGSAL